MTTLQVTTRKGDKKLEILRAEGLMPAVFYGKKEEATSIALPQVEFLKTWREAGESTVIVLERDGEDSVEVLIHDVQLDPLTEMPIHADFYAFERGVMLEMNVELTFIGTAPAVKNLGGILVKVMHELPIKALPKNLPHDIEIDVSTLTDFDSKIIASDIRLPDGVELDMDPEEVIAGVEAPHEEEPDEAPTEIDMSAVQVEKKGKAEDEEGGEEGKE